jgi:hypothetical protein
MVKVHELDQSIIASGIVAAALWDHESGGSFEDEYDEDEEFEMDPCATLAAQEIARLFVQVGGSIEIDVADIASKLPVEVCNSPATDPTDAHRVADALGYLIYNQISGVGDGFDEADFGQAAKPLSDAVNALGLSCHTDTDWSGYVKIYMGRNLVRVNGDAERTHSHWDTEENRWIEWTPVRDI